MKEAEQKATILIVEDDLDIADMLNAYFRVQGYDVLTVNWGEDGVNACQSNLPNLVILDIRLPDIDGFEVARRLRSNRRTREIPIIFLTEKRERHDKLKGLELSAEDYITKPFDIQELRLRVRNALQRAQRSTLTNPVTGIPEGPLVDEQIEKCMQTGDYTLLVLVLKNINSFREMYGFVASDDLMRALALMLENTLREADLPYSFLGHLSPTDFLVIVKGGGIAPLRERIRRRLDQSFDYFYRDQDRDTELYRQRRLAMLVHEFDPVQFQSVQQFKQEAERVMR